MLTCVISKSFLKSNWGGFCSVITNLLSAREAKLQTATCKRERKLASPYALLNNDASVCPLTPPFQSTFYYLI